MKYRVLIVFLLTGLLINSCVTSPKASAQLPTETSAVEAAPTASPTAKPTDTPVPPDTPVPTATPVPTNTPVPTDTPSPTPNSTATVAAQATQQAADAIAKIKPILEEVHLTTDQGSLAWVQKDPVDIMVDEYGEERTIPIDPILILSDFALYVDVTWESKSGLAGCGIVFHAEKDTSAEHYRFLTLRLSGVPAWDVEYWDFGRWQSTTTGKVKYNNAINLKQGAKNTYILVMQEGLLTVYGNGEKLGHMDIAKRSNGKVFFLAFQESMKTTCTFENAWVWSLK